MVSGFFWAMAAIWFSSLAVALRYSRMAGRRAWPASVSVTPLWKDVKSDDDDGPKPPVPTPDDPVKPPVPAPDDKWHNHKGNGTNNGTNNGADGAAQSPKTFDAGIAAYAAAAVLSLSGAAGLRRRKKSGK